MSHLFLLGIADTYSEPCETSKMELLRKQLMSESH